FVSPRSIIEPRDDQLSGTLRAVDLRHGKPGSGAKRPGTSAASTCRYNGATMRGRTPARLSESATSHQVDRAQAKGLRFSGRRPTTIGAPLPGQTGSQTRGPPRALESRTHPHGTENHSPRP